VFTSILPPGYLANPNRNTVRRTATETATQTLLNISLDLSFAARQLFVLNPESKMLDTEGHGPRSTIDNDLAMRPNSNIAG
jgi:hypothetical protein